jgi:hypothetical protein
MEEIQVKVFTRKIFYCFIIPALILTGITGCSESTPDVMDLVPDNASIIGSIQVKEIINDKDLINAYDDTEKAPDQPETFDDAMDQVLEEIGLDLRDCTKITMFADMTLFTEEQYLAFIVEGNFNEKDVINNLEDISETELVTRDYKGYTLYFDDEDDFGIVFPSSKMFILGTTEAIEDAIDTSKGDREKISGTTLDTYNQLGDSLLRFVFEYPEAARRALNEEQAQGDFPLSTESFSDIDIIGMSIDKEGEIVNIRLNPHFSSADSAKDVENTLNGFIMLFKGMGGDAELSKLLDKISIVVSGSWVKISMDITTSEIGDLMESLQEQAENR